MIVTTIFTLFVLYTIACCMDGPDLKPLWKRWLGMKLEAKANSLHPINYCNKGDCQYFLQWMPPQKPIPVEVHQYGMKRIAHDVHINESQLMRARYHEEMARAHNIPLPQFQTVEGLVNDAKELCARMLLDSILPYINFKVTNGDWRPEIIVSGSIEVSTPKNELI